MEEHSNDIVCGVTQNYQNAFFTKLFEYFEEQKFCDVTLIVGQSKEPIKAHKVVLACGSDVLKTLLEYHEGQSEICCLQDFDSDAIKLLISYFYIGQITFPRDKLETVLPVADYLCATAFCEEISDYMEKQLTIKNCPEFFTLADAFNLLALKNRCIKLAVRNFSALMKYYEKLQFTVPLLKQVLSSQDLFIPNENGDYQTPERQEEIILNFVMTYLDALNENILSCAEYDHEETSSNHSFPDMEKAAVEILQCVRLTIIPAFQLKDAFSKHCVKAFPSCRTLLADVLHKQGTEPPEYRCKYVPKTFVSKRLANGGQLSLSPSNFSLLERRDSVVMGMKIFVKIWENKKVLSGIEVKYNNDETTPLYGSRSEEEYQIELRPQERIIEIKARHGFLIDMLSFHTNFGQDFGPFGGSGGSETWLQPPAGRDAYLAGVSGSVVDSNEGWRVLTKLQFVWKYFVLEQVE